MNDRKIAFIICVNNEIYFEECQYYINRLSVPEGYEIELFCIREATSMCAGYNIGMQNSDAKYKIYMHQDVFIQKIDFLNDILDLLKGNNEIGMIGMIGGTKMPKSGVAYRAWNVGKVDCREPDLSYYLMGALDISKDIYVEAVDGLILITQYDLPWREDLFHNFDFYDVSQSFEMRKRGYKILVPYQSMPWVIHDSSFAKLNYYDANRKICLKEYSDYMYAEDGYEFRYNKEWDELSDELSIKIKDMMAAGLWNKANEVISSYRQGKLKDSELEMLGVILDIYQQEMESNTKTNFFVGLNSYDQIYQKYIKVRFLMRRMELGFERESYMELEQAVRKNEISYEAIINIMIHSTINKKRVLSELEKFYRESEQKENERNVSAIYNKIKFNDIPIAYTKRG